VQDDMRFTRFFTDAAIRRGPTGMQAIPGLVMAMVSDIILLYGAGFFSWPP
jgi:hypothetical protein